MDPEAKPLEPEQRQMIDFLLMAGQDFSALETTQDFVRSFRVLERTASKVVLLYWAGAVLEVDLDAQGATAGHRVLRMRRTPPLGARPGRHVLPIQVRTWGEMLALLRLDRVQITWIDSLPDEVEVHGRRKRAQDPEPGPVVYRFVIEDRGSIERASPLEFGPGRSRALDAVEWLWIAEDILEVEPTSVEELKVAAACFGQMAEFLEGDEVTHDPAAFDEPPTARFREKWPEQFTRQYIESQRERLAARIAEGAQASDRGAPTS